MSAAGGSIQEISVRGRILAVASDADASVDLGGYEAEQQANGNGTSRKVLKSKNWMIENLTVSIDDNIADLEFLQECADSTDDVDITITFVNGVVYGGSGTVVGKVAKSTQGTTAGISLSGPGKLVQQ
jgi:hypothetical protein